jgi:hypothetical protein
MTMRTATFLLLLAVSWSCDGGDDGVGEERASLAVIRRDAATVPIPVSDAAVPVPGRDASVPFPGSDAGLPRIDATVPGPTTDAGTPRDAGPPDAGTPHDAGDLCDGVVCAPAGECYTVACNPSTGYCESTPRPDGTECDDLDDCTTDETCSDGLCTGGTLDTSNPDCCQCECETCGSYCGCAPSTCEGLEATCGTLSDGCGGTIECGECESPEWCGGGGVDNQCGCTPATCEILGFNCGIVDDGCGGVLDCGTCSGDQSCGGDPYRSPNVCGCTPVDRCPVDGCGYAPDGCGSYVFCGSCESGGFCDSNNQCICNSPGCLQGEPEPIPNVTCLGASPGDPLCCNEENDYDCYGPWQRPEGPSYIPADPGTETELPPSGGVEGPSCGPGCFSPEEE